MDVQSVRQVGEKAQARKRTRLPFLEGAAGAAAARLGASSRHRHRDATRGVSPRMVQAGRQARRPTAFDGAAPRRVEFTLHADQPSQCMRLLAALVRPDTHVPAPLAF